MLFHQFSRGKFLLNSEYFILDGAKGIALPTIYGQYLTVEESKIEPHILIYWQSLSEKKTWLSFELTHEFDLVHLVGDKKSANLIRSIFMDNKVILKSKNQTFFFKMEADFPSYWGLGSSSTFIYNLSAFLKCNPFELNQKYFKGSGYDIAVAQVGNSIVFNLKDSIAQYHQIDFNPPFLNCLYFVYLNHKQNSRNGIVQYRNQSLATEKYIEPLNQITNDIMHSKQLSEFEKLLNKHEYIIAEALKMIPVKQQLFSDYWGAIKSLGAWGGDFVLACSNCSQKETMEYFHQKGFFTVLPYKDIIFAPKNTDSLE